MTAQRPANTHYTLSTMQNNAPPDDEQDDIALFRQQMQDVTPLKPGNRIAPPPRRKTPRLRREHRDVHDTGGLAIREQLDPPPEILSFQRPGVQHRVMKQLRQGKLPIDERIDLHGLTAEQARAYLLDFLDECRLQGHRVVLMVHGKGQRSKNNIPVIKALLNHWLRECQQVLAFHSATARDGGSGAVYVLLKKEA